MNNPFADYNKNNTLGTLVGNWVEEEALRNDTGFSRRKVPAPQYVPDFIESRHESTYNRVLAHADRPKSGAEFSTTSQEYQRHASATNNSSGPRERSREEELRKKAQAMFEQEKRERQSQSSKPTVSTMKEDFCSSEGPLGSGPRNVGNTGERLAYNTGEADSIDQMKTHIFQQSAHNREITITKYSYALATGVGLDYPATVSDSSNPFGRSSAFTNDIRDPTKRHAEASEPGSCHQERLGRSVHQRAALRKLASQVESREIFQYLTDELQKVSQNGILQLADYRRVLREMHPTVSLTDKEAIHVFMAFDLDSVGAVQVEDMISELSRSQL